METLSLVIFAGRLLIDDQALHFMPAMKKGILEMRAEIASVVDNPKPATFDNTIVALEKSGNLVSKVARVFSSLTGTERNDTLSALESKIWPMLTREQDKITLNDTLYARVKSVYDQSASLGLDEQDARLLELTHRNFVRAGAALAPDVKTQVAAINAELSGLTTTFGQNLIRETKSFKISVTDEADVAGLSDDFKAALWDDETKAWVLGLDRSVYENFMVQSENRDLRKQMFDGYTQRASQGEYDNGPVLIKIAQLRAKRAELMGYKSHAHYELETRMAKTPQGAEDFLKRVWAPGLEKAKIERTEMQEIVGDAFTIESHDWWHYAEKVRQAKYAFDENALKPYFELNAVREGAFEMARRLFGVTFEPVEIDTWNDVVTSYDMKDAEGKHVGLFMMDMYARDSKRGGAWMSGYRSTSNIGGEVIRPIITNNLNLSTPPEGEPTLMRFSEVETLFHEFGHGLHGLLTQIDYPTFSGVDGPRDYTEFPAQILEHWAAEPEMLAMYATHYKSGDVIPQVTGVAISDEVLDLLGGHENLIGVKDSTGDPGELRRLTGRFEDGCYLVGNDRLVTACVEAGGDGSISAAASVAPAMVSAVQRGEATQSDLVRVRALLEEYGLGPSVKSLLRRFGFGDFATRPPMVGLEEARAPALWDAYCELIPADRRPV